MTNKTASLDERDPIPPDLSAVTKLFAESLKNVVFPDVDAALLAAQTDQVRASTREVERALVALAAAQATRTAHLAQLSSNCDRALAYARIYAAASPDRKALGEAIEALVAPRASALAQKNPGLKRRGRPPKTSGETLFDETSEVAELASAAAS